MSMKRAISIALLGILLSGALAFEGAYADVTQVGSTTTNIASGGTCTPGSGSNRVLVIAIANRTSDTGTNLTPAITAMSVGSASVANGQLIQAATVEQHFGSNDRTSLYYVKEANIGGGAQTISVTWQHAMAGADEISCYTLQGVNQTTPVDNTFTYTQGSGTTTWTGSFAVVSGSFQVLAGLTLGPSVTATANVNWTEDYDSAIGTQAHITTQHKATTTGTTLTWEVIWSSGSQGTAAGVSFAPDPTSLSGVAAGTATTSSVAANATSNATGTLYAARLSDGATTPATCSPIEAQTATGALQYNSKAVTASVADSISFTGITSGVKSDIVLCVKTTGGTYSSVYRLEDLYKLPAWTTDPACSASSSSAVSCTFQLDGPGEVFAVFCKKDLNDATTPAQVVAPACSASLLASANKSVTGSDSITLSGITLPVGDAFLVGRYVAGTNSARFDQLDKALNAPAGYGAYVVLGSIGPQPTNPINDYNSKFATDVAPGDYATVSVSAPSGYPVTLTTSGNLVVDGNPTAELFKLRYYDVSAGDWMLEASPGSEHEVFVNFEQPVCEGRGYISGAIKINTSPGTVALTEFATDPQVSPLTWSLFSGSLAGRSLNSSTGNLTGPIQSTEVESGVAAVVRATNAADLFCELPVLQYPIDTVTVPVCASLTSCESQLSARWLTGSTSFSLSTSVAGGSIVGQTPAANTEAEPYTNVAITYSSGLVQNVAQSNGYQVNVTPLNDVTAYAVALKRNACAPNPAQLAAGTDCLGNPALAKTVSTLEAAIAAPLTLTGLGLPRHDIYVATQASDGSFSQVLSLLNQQKLPQSGRQYIEVSP